MADVDSNNRRNRGSRRKIHNIKVDLTPMVDLGFLLITFFIFTKVLSEPKVAELFLPKDTIVRMEIKESAVLTIVLEKNDQLKYYHGSIDTARVYTTGFAGIRSVIIQKQKSVAKKLGDKYETILIIKPDSTSVYKNLVDMLDEIMINDITRYFLSDVSPEERKFLQ